MHPKYLLLKLESVLNSISLVLHIFILDSGHVNVEITGGTFTRAIDFGLLVTEPWVSGPKWIILHVPLFIFFSLLVVLRVQAFRYLLIWGDIGTRAG